MTQENKQLLLKDLCARLPYGINIRIKYYDLQGDGELASKDVKLTAGNICYCFDNGHWVDIKPYLRPMSSMTEEEKKEYHKQVDIDLGRTAEVLREQIETGTFNTDNRYTPQYCHIDWLNAHHFDYRGLIPMGLALEAKEGMYKTE